MDRDQARKNVRSLLRGSAPKRELSLAEAKARLRAADPEIDISVPLRLLNQGRPGQATRSLAAEIVSSVTLPYIQPLVTGLVSALLGAGQKQLKK